MCESTVRTHRRRAKSHRGCKWLHKFRIYALHQRGNGEFALWRARCRRCGRRKLVVA